MQNTPGNYVSASFVMPLYILIYQHLWVRARATRFYRPWGQNMSAFIQKDDSDKEIMFLFVKKKLFPWV